MERRIGNKRDYSGEPDDRAGGEPVHRFAGDEADTEAGATEKGDWEMIDREAIQERAEAKFAGIGVLRKANEPHLLRIVDFAAEEVERAVSDYKAAMLASMLNAVTSIRCMAHIAVPKYNTSAAGDAECAACAVGQVIVDIGRIAGSSNG